MYAILNYYDNAAVQEQQVIRNGDKIIANSFGDNFQLIEGKEYEVVEVVGINLVLIVNDYGEKDLLNVKYFTI